MSFRYLCTCTRIAYIFRVVCFQRQKPKIDDRQSMCDPFAVYL